MTGEIHHLYDLTSKVAMVTGGGSGLGREFCDVLAEFGTDIICPDLYQDRAEETCKIVKKYQHKAMAMAVDMSKYDQVHTMFQKVMASFGKLDILVNNAGIAPPSVPIDQMDLKDWHSVIDVDLHGVFYCMKEGLRIMREQGRRFNYQYFLDPRSYRIRAGDTGAITLCRRQTCRNRAYQTGGGGIRAVWYSRQLYCSRISPRDKIAGKPGN